VLFNKINSIKLLLVDEVLIKHYFDGKLQNTAQKDSNLIYIRRFSIFWHGKYGVR